MAPSVVRTTVTYIAIDFAFADFKLVRVYCRTFCLEKEMMEDSFLEMVGTSILVRGG